VPSVRRLERWAHLVGALRVHPHKHRADHPPQKDRGFARGGRGHVPSRSRLGWQSTRAAVLS